MPNVSGYSPVQWAMGYTPHIPGLLMEEQITPIHLDPTEAFKEKLELQASAAKAITEANIDARLRRALLRKFVGQPLVLNSGDRCYYWRDGPANGPKLRWRGPAVVVMKETSEAGPHADIYWLAHGTTLLRAAPEHVRPAMHPENDESRAMDSIDRAKLALMKVRNRGVTHYIDLPKSNKRKREEVASEDEAEELDHEMGDFEAEPLQDRWQASDDGRTWTRIHNQGRQQLFVPDLLYDEVPFHLFTNERVTHIRRGGPNPETLVVRDEWNGPDADRKMHYTVGLGQQPLWWTLACRPAIQMGRCDSSSAEVDPLLAALVDQMMIQLPPSEDSHQCLRARASPTMRTCEELMVEALQTMQQHRPFWPNPWMMDKINEPCCPHLLAV